ncbi:MAG: formyltransferase family protein [bacterium]
MGDAAQRALAIKGGRVLYFGDPRGGLALLARGVTLVGVVHGRRGGPGARAFLAALAGVPRFNQPDLGDPAVVAALAALAPDLLVAGFYPRIIPPAVLALAPGINVHPSDLPRWRGPDPVHWAVRAGDRATAICVHLLTEGLDEGDVLTREPVPIQPRESAGHLADRIEAQAADRLAEVAMRLVAGEALPLHPQTGTVTWAPLVPADDLEVDWTRPAAEVDALVRAGAPWPGAYTGLVGELLVLYAGRAEAADKFEALPPGTPFVRGGRAFIRCGEGAWRIDRARLGRKLITGKALARLLV